MKKMFVTVLLAALAGSAAQAGVLAPGLAAHMDQLDDHEVLKVLVVMQDQANVLSMDLDLHDQGAPLAVRHNTIVTSLRDAAARSQKDLVGDLRYREADKATGGVRGFTPHWIVNSIVLVAEVGVIRQIAARDDVEVVEANLEVELIEPVMIKTAADKSDKSAQEGGEVAPGVEMVNAPRVWHELGFDGTGTIVANMDSGVDATHDFLFDRWRGNHAPPEECWRDHAEVGSPDFPVDQHGHGTHTMGTITGASGVDTTGVAPGSQWISSNAIYTGGTRENFDNAVIAAFEFFADPDGDPTTSDEVPDVVQNSWGVSPNPAFGYVPCDSRWWDAIDNCEAAGVVVTWSAGNEGPGKGTLRSPGDRASSPTNCFTVGSVGYAIPYAVSSFSSRGPSACGGAYAIKPEVVAPGEDILSTYPGNNFAYMSGTSMAGPHVAGIVSLMRQANPDLDVIDIKQILMDTALEVGVPGEDNASGWGMVDAYAAVIAAMTQKGVIEGQVTDSVSGLPLAGVEVQRTGFTTVYLTDADGRYSMTVRSGPTSVEFSKFSYTPQIHTMDLMDGETLVLDVIFERRPVGTVSGVVYGPDGRPVRGATVRVAGIPLDPVVTEHYGAYEFELPVFDEASYELVASAENMAYVVEYIGLPESRVLDIHLPNIQAEGFESGTLTTYPWQMGGNAPMYVDVTEVQEGAFSVRSGNISDQETSEMSVAYFVAGEGDISFSLKTECEDGYDGLLFYIDNVAMASWSGENDWTRVSFGVSPGSHIFKWVYVKDFAVSIKRDAAWIDGIEFPGTGIAPVPGLEVDQTSVSMMFHAEAADSTALSLFNSGGYALDYSTRIVPFVVNGTFGADDLTGRNPKELISQGILNNPDKSGEPGWVDVMPASGTIHPGVGKDLAVHFDSAGLTDGTYYSLLEITSNDPSQPLLTVPLIMTLASVSGVHDSVQPARLELTGAVPNPFNPMTHVTFNMPVAGEVTLRIYDVSGRLVRDLASGPRSAGRHSELWNGKDQQGMDVSSGVYFARLNVAGQMKMKSMLLLR